MRRALDLGGALCYAWVIPAAFFLLILAAAYWRFRQALPPRSRRLFVLAALVYVGGAFGTEFYVNYWVAPYGTDPVYGLLNIVQEMMEFTGLSLFIAALLGHLRGAIGELRVVVD
ncbi:MAG: hypothetical protein O2967_03525 [Proteobacteria bacterium]|nr:hypothetical protein [Pseudomonadota bacterium]